MMSNDSVKLLSTYKCAVTQERLDFTKTRLLVRLDHTIQHPTPSLSPTPSPGNILSLFRPLPFPTVPRNRRYMNYHTQSEGSRYYMA